MVRGYSQAQRQDHQDQVIHRNKNLANESLEDSLIDICVYGVLALQLYREANYCPADEAEVQVADR